MCRQAVFCPANKVTPKGVKCLQHRRFSTVAFYRQGHP